MRKQKASASITEQTFMEYTEDIRITETIQDVCNQAGPYRAFPGQTPCPYTLL